MADNKIVEKRKVGRPKGTTGSYKDENEKRTIKFNIDVSPNEKKIIDKVLNLKKFEGWSNRKIILKLMKDQL